MLTTVRIALFRESNAAPNTPGLQLNIDDVWTGQGGRYELVHLTANTPMVYTWPNGSPENFVYIVAWVPSPATIAGIFRVHQHGATGDINGWSTDLQIDVQVPFLLPRTYEGFGFDISCSVDCDASLCFF